MNEAKLKIFLVAFKLFLQKGFVEVTINEILNNSELSRGTFYYYFKSKEQLYKEVIDMFFVSISKTTQNTYNDNSLYDFYHDYLDKASQAYSKLRPMLAEANVNVFSYFSLSIDALKRLPDYRGKMNLTNAENLKVWIKIIKSAREKGEISSEMTDEQIANFFKFTMEGMGMKSKLENKTSEENDIELLKFWDNFYYQIKA